MIRKPRNRTPDVRHSQVKALLAQYWQRENPAVPDMPWGPADAGGLSLFLKANPSLTVETVARCLLHRLASDDHAPAERIYIWIAGVLRYAAGPLDRFRLQKRIASQATVGMRHDDNPFAELHPEPSAEQTLAELMGPESVARVRAKHAAGHAPLLDWERNMLRELGDM